MKIIMLNLMIALAVTKESFSRTSENIFCPDLTLVGPNKETIVGGREAIFTVVLQKEFDKTDIQYT